MHYGFIVVSPLSINSSKICSTDLTTILYQFPSTNYFLTFMCLKSWLCWKEIGKLQSIVYKHCCITNYFKVTEVYSLGSQQLFLKDFLVLSIGPQMVASNTKFMRSFLMEVKKKPITIEERDHEMLYTPINLYISYLASTMFSW